MRKLNIRLTSRRPLRVLTVNTWGFTEPYAARQRLLRDGIRKLAPDLMAFQEAGSDGKRHQVAELLDGLGYHILHQFDQSASQGCDRGNCVASRWPMDLVELCSLRLTKRCRQYPYAALAVRIAAPAPVGSVLFVNAIPSWELNCEYERELQAVKLAKLVARHAPQAGFPPIITGDFDATPDSASIRFLKGQQSLAGLSVHYRDAWAEAGDGSEGHTWTWRNRYARDLTRSILQEKHHARRIDYVFLGSPHDFRSYARIRRCRVVLNRPNRGVWPSDHYAVYAEIDVIP